jgi:hypothetical protein
MNDIFASPEFIRWAATIAGGAVAAAIIALALRLSAGELFKIWQFVRGEVPAVIEAFDDPDDPLVLWLDKYIPGNATAVINQALPAFLRIVADKLDDQINKSDSGEAASEPPNLPAQSQDLNCLALCQERK